MVFQSTPSAWRETDPEKVEGVRKWHFNPLPPHGGRQCAMDMIFRCRIISIHSLRMEGDPILDTQVLVHRDFNPLPPHGGRPVDGTVETCVFSFQSTPSAWRETNRTLPSGAATIFQSTPSAWRETILPSIHPIDREFQSTPSAWRETDQGI